MGNSIVFVDWRVADIDSLVGGMPSDSEVVILDSASDGLDQIAAHLRGRFEIEAINIISHGTSGCVTLGSGVIDADALSSDASQLEAIGKSLTESGDILLYGCNVAAGDARVKFTASLAQEMGVDVASGSVLRAIRRLDTYEPRTHLSLVPG